MHWVLQLRGTMSLIWQATLLVTVLCTIQCSKILLVPVDHTGHVNFFIVSGKALSALGHDVHVLTVAKYRKKVEDAGLKSIPHTPSPEAISVMDDPEIANMLQGLLDTEQIVMFSRTAPKLLRRMTGQIVKQCEDVLQNKQIEEKIEDIKFDLAIVDSFPLARCLFTLVYRHSLRYVALSDLDANFWDVKVPSMLSVEPLPFTALTNQMSFPQRLFNCATFVLQRCMLHVFEPKHMVETYVPNKPVVSLFEIYRQSEMFFNNVDILLMDYPRVSSPHYIYIGSMGGSPPQPLATDLDDFVSSAKDGAIIVSFGSLFSRLPQHFMQKLFAIFSNFPTRNFIMRSEINTTLPNVKTMKWLPQNDLLGQKNVKLFITHGGANGQAECLYHGVPMVVAPLFGDQPYDAARVEHKKYGLKIHMFNDSPEDMTKIIKEVLENPVYTQNIKKASEIYKALPKANETIAYWVDHILKFGSDHIRPSYIDMPLYQFFMLDILVFVIIVVVVLCFVLYKCCRCCMSCTKKLNKPKTE